MCAQAADEIFLVRYRPDHSWASGDVEDFQVLCMPASFSGISDAQCVQYLLLVGNVTILNTRRDHHLVQSIDTVLKKLVDLSFASDGFYSTVVHLAWNAIEETRRPRQDDRN